MLSIINDITKYMPILLSAYYIYNYIRESDRKVDFLSYFLILTLPMMYMNTSILFYYKFVNIEIVVVVIKSLIDFFNGNIKITISESMKWYVLFFLVIFILGLISGIDAELYSGIRNMCCFSLCILFVYKNISENLSLLYKPMLLNLISTSLLSILEVIIYYMTHESFILRPMGFASNANYNSFFILWMFLFISYAVERKQVFCIAILAILATLSTQSSAGMLGIMICLCGKRKLSKDIIRLMIFGAFTLVFLIVIIRLVNYDVFLKMFPSQGDRMVLWSIWAQGFKEHPLSGFGYNKFAIRYRDYIVGERAISQKAIAMLRIYTGLDPNYSIPERLASHNDLIKLLTETGIVGTFLFCIYIHKIMKESSKTSALVLKMIAVTIVYFLTNNPLNTPLFYMGCFSVVFLEKGENKNGFRIIWKPKPKLLHAKPISGVRIR